MKAPGSLPVLKRAALFAFALALTVEDVSAWPVKELWVQWSGAAVAVDDAGNVFVTGDGGEDECYTAKYAAADGALRWAKRHTCRRYTPNMILDGAGNVIVSGHRLDGGSFVLKYAAADGSLMWESRAFLSESIAVDSSNNVISTGKIGAEKFAAANGALLWRNRGPRSFYYHHGFTVAVDGAGNAIVAGIVSDFFHNSQGHTAKYAASDGALLWEHRFGSGEFGKPIGVAVDSAGNAVITGWSSYRCDYFDEDHPECFYDMHTVKYSPNGSLLWERYRHKPYPSSLMAADVVIDTAGDVIVTAADQQNGTFHTEKYSAPDGALLWQKRHRSGHAHDAGPKGVAVDGEGNVVVTGADAELDNKNPYNTDTRYYTAKYAAGNGMLLWRMSYGDPDYDSRPKSVAVGPGFVVVIGSSSNDRGFNNKATVKYVDGATPQTFGADGVSSTEATLHGKVNPNSFATEAAFEYGTDPTLARAATSTPVAIGQGTAAVRVTARLSQLAPMTTYHYRAIGNTNGHTTHGAILSFTTAPFTKAPSAPRPPAPGSGTSSPARATPVPARVR